LGTAHLSTQTAASFIGQSAVQQLYFGQQKTPALSSEKADVHQNKPVMAYRGRSLSSEAMHFDFQQAS